MFPVPFSVTFSGSMFKISHIYMDCNCFVCLLLFSQFFYVIFMQLSQFIPCKTPFDPCDACELFRCKAAPAILQRMIHGLLRISCSRNPKTPQIRSFFYEKWLLFGVLRVNKSCFSCKHETHDLLTLVSSQKEGYQTFSSSGSPIDE